MLTYLGYNCPIWFVCIQDQCLMREIVNHCFVQRSDPLLLVLKARKFVHLPAQWVNVPRHVVEDLISQSQGAVLSSLDGLIISNGSVSLPRASIQAMFEVIDDYLTGTPYVPSDSTDSQVRGLGSMVAF